MCNILIYLYITYIISFYHFIYYKYYVLYYIYLKAHSKVRDLITESPLEMMKNASYFTLKALFVLKIFIFVMTFWSCRKNGSIRKIMLISKSMMSQPG